MNPDTHECVMFWFRRDLRLQDNAGLFEALNSGYKVVPVFIFDTVILDPLKDPKDKRVTFIHSTLKSLHNQLLDVKSGLIVRHGELEVVWNELFNRYKPKALYLNHDYEPYAIERDNRIEKLCKSQGIRFRSCKDQVIFEKDEVVKPDGKPYTVFTPFKNRWLKTLQPTDLETKDSKANLNQFFKFENTPQLPGLKEIGFEPADTRFPDSVPDLQIIRNYHSTRDFPAIDGTTHLGLHLRFGTVSIRELVQLAIHENDVWLSELIWREFFMMILYHFPPC